MAWAICVVGGNMSPTMIAILMVVFTSIAIFLLQTAVRKSDDFVVLGILSASYVISTMIHQHIVFDFDGFISQWFFRGWLYGLLSATVFILCMFLGMKGLSQSSAGRVIPIWSTFPAVSMIIFALPLPIHFEIKTWIILALILVGAVVASVCSGGLKKNAHVFTSFLAVVCFVLMLYWQSGSLMFYFVAFVCILSWIYVFVTGGIRKLRSLSFLDGLYTVIAGILFYLSFQFHALIGQETQTIKIIFQMFTVVVVAMACILGKEKIKTREFIGIFMLEAGLLLLIIW